MPETTTTRDTSGAAPILMCDEPGCSEVATHSYTWDWGKTGNVCATHAARYKQIAPNLKRSVTFAPLMQMKPAALTRDERTQLIAAKLSAEAECGEIQARGLELYNQNTELARQLGSLKVRHTECEAQLRDAMGKALELEEALVTSQAERAELAQECMRLKALIPREPPATSQPRRGGGKDTVTTTGEASGEKK